MAILLSVITIVYNTIEGMVSVYFGSTDGTRVLLGFGIYSFVEVKYRHRYSAPVYPDARA